MRDVFMDVLELQSSPPRKPPLPPARPVKVGGNGEVPAGRSAAPVVRVEPVARAEPVAEERPACAGAIDRLVADMVARGQVTFDAVADCYRGPHWRRYRWGD